MKDLIRKLLRERLNDSSHFLSKSEKYGSYEGIIHSSPDRIKNWFLTRGIDYSKYESVITTPVAF
jgi:hypothetical protein